MNFWDKLVYYFKTGTFAIKFMYGSAVLSLGLFFINILIGNLFHLYLSDFLLLSKSYFFPCIWTFISYSLFTNGIWEFFMFCLMMYFIDKMFKIYFNERSFIKFFIGGILSGGIIFILCSFIFNYDYPLSGGITGIYAVLFAIISYNPKMKVSLFPLPISFPIYLLGLILIGLDIFNFYRAEGIIFSRIGAAAFGYLYMKQFEQGKDFLDLKFAKNLFKPRKKSNFTYQKNPQFSSKAKTDEEFNSNKIEKQKKIDAILDKISKDGYDKLTKEEKDFLFNSSK